MISIRFVSNPFYCYCIGFMSALIIYTWGWSDLYPKLELNVIIFLLITILISLLLGLFFDKSISYKNIKINSNNSIYTLLIVIGYTIEFIYNKGIPLILILNGDEYSHYNFGIPTFHVFIQTISPFYTVYLFHQYLSSKNKTILVYFLILVLLSIIEVNRGATLMTLWACLVVFSQKRQFISYTTFTKLVAAFILIFYLFGYVGFARSFNSKQDLLFEVAQTTSEFKESVIPGEFFWLYLYAASPIANFQNLVNIDKNIRYNIPSYIVAELLPDFISKRIVDPETDIDAVESQKFLIANFLTVGSTYYAPYRRMGWIGVTIIYIWLMSICVLFYFLRGITMDYSSTMISILCTMTLFSIFDNMIHFTGLSFQLIYPIVFGVLNAYTFKFNNG